MSGTKGASSARRPWRAVDGIVLLDKPPGLGSTTALQRVRRLLRAAKAGHAGTLDPMATGMLPLCFGQATKACGQLLGSSKAYRAELSLGARTDTADAMGTVLERGPVPALQEGAVRDLCRSLVGPQLQTPPMYSALKKDGRPLYELARRGEEVARAPREIVIQRLEPVEIAGDRLVFEVECSKGTYVRVLGEDIARGLGTLGFLSALRRLWVAPFQQAEMVTLEAVEAWAQAASDEDLPPWLLPVDIAFEGLPRLDLDRVSTEQLCQGRVLALPLAAGEISGLGRAYDPAGRFLGLVQVAGGQVRVQRLFVPGAGTGASEA